MNLIAPLIAAAVLAQAPATPPEVGVPFGCGLTFPVSQAHAVGSHANNDVWAWDFRMPEGTPIVAASDGVVRMARGDSTIGGCDAQFAPYANYVVVAHPNGYETQYLHFREVVVKQGDHVKAGQLLGYSGKTGWACGAHLHFKVATPVSVGWNNPSVPARIFGYGDPQLDAQIAAPTCTARPLMANIATESAKMADATKNEPARGASAAPAEPTASPKPARTQTPAPVPAREKPADAQAT